MARIGRIVIPGFSHHVTQRGNRRQPVFFDPSDDALCRDLLAERCRKASVEVWAHCLMPNHVHLVLTPHTPDGLARAIGETHRQYTWFVNASSQSSLRRLRKLVCLDRTSLSRSVLVGGARRSALMAAARYVALNPVAGEFVAHPQDWEWSSVRAHLAERDDGLVRVAPLIERVGRFADLIDGETDLGLFAALRDAEGTGRPLGSDEFPKLERLTGRRLRRRTPGRKASERSNWNCEAEISKVSP